MTESTTDIEKSRKQSTKRVVSVLRLFALKGGIVIERDLKALAKEVKTKKVPEKNYVPDHFIRENI